jgi:diguanylate cyclase (GGDEF)-like protein
VIANYERTFQRRIFFVDQSGKVVLHSALTSAGELRPPLQNQPGIDQVAGQILTGHEKPLQLSYSHGGSTFHLNSRFIPELKWFLIVEENEQNAVQPVRLVLFWNLAIGASVTLLVLGALTVFLRRYQQRLEFFASTDPLTKTTNRRKGEELLLAALCSSRSPKLSVLLIDIDHFKAVNDQFGHPVGDIVIEGVVDQISRAVRSTDHVIRWGGEEFLVLLHSCDITAAEKIGCTILDLVATQHLRHEQTIPGVTVSIGLASLDGEESRESLLTRVDTALYLAKTSGRNQLQQADRSTASATA